MRIGIVKMVRHRMSRFVISSVLELVLLYMTLLVLTFAVLAHLISLWWVMLQILNTIQPYSSASAVTALSDTFVGQPAFVILYTMGLGALPISFLASIQVKNNVPAVTGVLLSWSLFITFIVSSSLFIPKYRLSKATIAFFDSFIIFYFIIVVTSSLLLIHVHMLVRELPLKPSRGGRKNTVMRFAGSVSNFIRFRYGKTTSPLFFFLIFHILNILLLLSATAYSRYVTFGTLINNAIGEASGTVQATTAYPGLISSILRFFIAIIGYPHGIASTQDGIEQLYGLPLSPGLFALVSTAIVGSIGLTAYLIIPYYEVLKDVRSAVHKYMISNVNSIISSTRNHLVIAGYGAMGKAIVRGIFQHELAEEKRWVREEMLWYLNEEDAVLDFKPVVTNMVIIDKEHEEWDYKIDDPVLNAVGIEEVTTTPGDRVLVPITGPTIVSDLMMRKINAYKAKAIVTTFRDPRVDTYMSQKLFDMDHMESPTIILRSLSAPLYSTITMHDILGQLHRYYPEYVFGTVILRRLWAEIVSLFTQKYRESNKNNKKIRFVPVIIGHSKLIYYILKSFLLMYDEYKNFVLLKQEQDGERRIRISRLPGEPNELIIPITKPLTNNEKHPLIGVDAIIISDEPNLIRNYVINIENWDNPEFRELKKVLLSIRMIRGDNYLSSKLGLYYASIRHSIRDGAIDKPHGSLVTPIIVSSVHDYVTLSKVINLFISNRVSRGTKQVDDTIAIPIFIVVTNIEGISMDIALELFKALKRIGSQYNYLRDYTIIVAWIYSNEWLRIKEYAFLHGEQIHRRLKLVNMYNLAKESVCTYTNLIMGGPDDVAGEG